MPETVVVSEQNAYDLAIAAAKERFDLALGDAAEDALFISERFDRPLQTVCREIGGEEAWEAIRGRARRLSSRSEGVETRPPALPPSSVRSARSVLTRDPEAVVAALSPEVRDRVVAAAVAAGARGGRARRSGATGNPVDLFVSPSALLAFMSMAATRVKRWYEKSSEWEDGIDAEMLASRFKKINEYVLLILQEKGMNASDF